MPNLYITEQNSIMRKTGDRLIVQKKDEILIDIQCHKIDAVLIFGNVQFTTQAVKELFSQGIELAILTRTGRLVGQITSPFTKNISLRIKQFEKYSDDDFKLRFGKTIVKGKIMNGLALIIRHRKNHPDINLDQEISRLKASCESIESSKTVEMLMGVEGNGARAYFSAFQKMIRGDFIFPGRVKRPPTDPVNAMLSLTYTLVFNEISSLLDGIGFDPYLGYFHKPDYGRPSLAADLIEEFRAPAADRFVLTLVNRRCFKPEDFADTPKRGVYFRSDPMKKYFVEYEKWVNQVFYDPEIQKETNLRKTFRRQAEKLVGLLIRDEPYSYFNPI